MKVRELIRQLQALGGLDRDVLIASIGVHGIIDLDDLAGVSENGNGIQLETREFVEQCLSAGRDDVQVAEDPAELVEAGGTVDTDDWVEDDTIGPVDRDGDEE